MDHPHQTTFNSEIKTLVELSHSKVYQAVNFAMVQCDCPSGKRTGEEKQSRNEQADFETFLIENFFTTDLVLLNRFRKSELS